MSKETTTTASETESWTDMINPMTLPLRQQIGIVAVIVLGLLPIVTDTLTVLDLTGALYLAVFAMTWDFTSGYTGEISFGHAFFFATGGYTSAVLNVHMGLDPLITIPIGMVVAGLGGFLLGGPALRLEGPYLSLITMTAPLILLKIFIVFSDIFGGEVGLIGTSSLLQGALANYYVAFGLFVFSMVLFFVITRSDAGNVFTAIRENEDTVVAAGINPAKFKLFSFVLSATIGGLAGALLVHSNSGTATPSLLVALSVNITVIAATVVGGMGTIVGAAVGGLAFYMFRDYLSNVAAHIPVLGISVSEVDLISFYLLTVVVMFFLPQGIIPWLIDLGRSRLGGSGGEEAATVTDGGHSPLEQAASKFRDGFESLVGGEDK